MDTNDEKKHRLRMASPDLVAENIKKIRELFPHCVSESGAEGRLGIDFDLLRQELSAELCEGAQERYRLDWPGKRQALLTANTPIKKTLRPRPEQSTNFDTTENLFIEGDNLDALKLLQASYLGKVKMIYIDPPYNTGKDFIYKDKFKRSAEEELEESEQTDEEGNRLEVNPDSSGRYHSDWLSMIYPRLKLARNLLRDDGVIFISIDDKEQANLKRLCDEIFGEENFVGKISVAKGTTTGQDANQIGSSLDYLYFYAKNTASFELAGVPMNEQDIKRFSSEDERGKYSLLQFRKTGTNDRREDRPKLFYKLTAPDGSEVYPFGPSGYESRWRTSHTSFLTLASDNMIEWKRDKDNKYKPYVKYYLEGRTKQVSNLWNNIEGNKRASILLKELFKTKIFDFPKPVELIARCMQIANCKNNDIILDFFAGSGTTAHAVMQLNAEDGGNRKFIMVQLEEKCAETSEAAKAGYSTIAEIAKERIRRAGQKIKADSPTTTAEFDTGFRTLKIDSTNMRDVYYTPGETKQEQLEAFIDNIKDDRTSEDLLFQVMLDWGLPLDAPIEKREIAGCEVFFVAGNTLAACFAKGGEVGTDLCEALARHRSEYGDPLLRLVFRDAGFANDTAKVNAEQLFKQLSPNTDLRTL